MTRTTLLALAERVDAVTVSEQREMLEAAFVAVHGPKPERVHGGSPEWLAWLDLHNPFFALLQAGGFLDAAMSLVPSGATYTSVECLRIGTPDQAARAEVSWLADDGDEVRHGWATTAPVREVFKRAFAAADLPYFNPHSFRDMLVHHAMALNLSPEAMKAWSQNLGHADVLTTYTSYGAVPAHRQGELIRHAVTAGK